MRYQDGPTVEVSTTVNASAEQVWALISDIGTPVQFSEELQATEWITDGANPGVGSQFKGRNLHPQVGEWEVTCTVIEYEANKVFAWAVQDIDNPAARWWFSIGPTDDAGHETSNAVTLSQKAILGPGPSGLSAVIEQMPDKEGHIIENRLNHLETNMQANLDGIKALIEGTDESAAS